MESLRPRHIRLVFAALLAAASAGIFAAFAGTAGSSSVSQQYEYEYGHKVTICHKGKTTQVDDNSVDSHLAHGDRLGPC